MIRLALLAVACSTGARADLVFDAPLAEGEGASVIDAAADRAGTLDAVAWIEDGPGAAVEFNGVTSALTFPGDDGLNPTEALTVAAWVKFYAPEPKLQRVIQRASGTWGVYLSGANLTFYTKTGAEDDAWRSVSGKATIGEWVHLAATYDGEAMRIYLNGTPAGEVPQAGPLNSAGAAPLKLGHDSGGQTLNGALSAVRVWNEALDPAEIAREHRDHAVDYIPRSPFPASPIVLLGFDEGEGDEAADASPSGHNAHVLGDWDKGRAGSALRPAAVGGAAVGASDALNLGNQVTVEAWVRQDTATREMQRIAFRSSAYGLYTARETSVVTWYVMAGGEWSSVNAPLPQGRWVRVTGTYDGVGLRLYFDGAEVASAPKMGALDPNGSPLLIGHGGAPGDMPFQGLIDEVYVIGEAVTDFPERRTASVDDPDSVPFELVPFVADDIGGVPSIQVGGMPAPTLDGTVDNTEWSAAARVELRDAASGQAPRDATVARVGYSDDALHVSYVCAESDVEGMQFVAEATERDGDVWMDDCAEVFIQPGPPDGEYYHFTINPLGTIYDAKGKSAAYNSAAEVGVSIDEQADEWTLELSIPWADLGADGPPVGGEWAINLCREQYPQKDLYAWSPTRSFHQVDRFGRVSWAEVSRTAQAGKATVYGRITRDGGEGAASGVTVRIGDRFGMTRGDGVFKIAGVPEGDVLLTIEPSPIHHPVALKLTASAPQTIVIPPPLERVDLQAHALDLPDGPALSVLPLPLFDEPPIAGDTPPFPANPALAMAATPGEYEPISFCVYAAEDANGLSVSVTDLTAADAVIPASRIDIRQAARTVQRKWYTSPISDSVVRTRYLFPAAAADIAAGQFRQYWLTLHVPGDAASGDYSGTVTVSGGGQEIELPMPVRVIAAALRNNPGKRYGAYYYGRTSRGIVDIHKTELPDMREHGCDFALWRGRIGYSLDDGEITVDHSSVRETIATLKAHGFKPPWLVWSGLERLSMLLKDEPERIEAEADKAIGGLLALAEEEEWGEIYLTHMDEVFNEGRLPRYIELTELIRKSSDVTVYQTIRADAPEMMARADEYIDVRSYNGHNMDEWISSGHSFDELARELEAAGDEAWIYYNPRSVDVTPEWTRMTNGLYMWLTPFKLHTPWIYNSYAGDPFDAEDGHDFGYAFPDEDGAPVPTLLWEAFREGVDDMRYIHTIEELIAEQEGTPAARAAQGYLDSLAARMRAIPIEKEPSAVVKAWASEFGPEDWREMRAELAKHLQALVGE